MHTNKKNSIWLATQYSIAIIFSLITLKLNLVNFGKELFGSWILVSSLWGFGRALDFGFGTSLIKFIAEYNYKDKSKLNFLLSTSFLLMLILGILILSLVIVIGKILYFSSNQIISPIHHDEIWGVFLILGLAFYLNYITIIIKSIFEGMNDFVTSSKINIIISTLTLLAVIIVYLLNLPLLMLAYLFLVNSLINVIIYFSMFRIRYSDIQLSLKYFRLSFAKRIFNFSLAIQGSTIFGSLIDPLIKYTIGNFGNIGTVSEYEIARRFVTAITGLFNTTFRTYLPKASILESKNDFNQFIYTECVKLSKIGITYSGIVFGVGSIIIPVIIQKLFNYDGAVLIFFILALPESINNFGYPIYNFFIGIGKAYFLIIVQIINLIIIGLSVSLGMIFLGNILGLLGYGFTVVVVNFLMIMFMRKITGISIKKYFMLSKTYKLIALIGLLLSIIIFISFKYFNLYMLVFCLSSLTLFIFLKDIKSYSYLLFHKE